MQSHYTFNVSYYGRHLFATHERSAVSITEAKELYRVLKQRFPENEGFEVRADYISVSGRLVNAELVS